MLFGVSGLILALTLTAIIKVLFDAIPSIEVFGFLIGEPEKELLKRNSTQVLPIKWVVYRKPKGTKKVEVDLKVENETGTETVTMTYKEVHESEVLPKDEDETDTSAKS